MWELIARLAVRNDRVRDTEETCSKITLDAI